MKKARKIWPLHQAFVKKYIHGLVAREAVKYARGNLLDIGCGEKPFQAELGKYVQNYLGIDDIHTPHLTDRIDVFADASQLPFKGEYFDIILLTQVLEHIKTPLDVMQEIRRVLKSDGILLISWPFLFPIHEEPRDYFRYTEYGMQELCHKSGFRILTIKALSGFWITYFSFLSIYLFRKSKIVFGISFPLLLLFRSFCVICEKLDRKSKSSWTWNYLCILRKDTIE